MYSFLSYTGYVFSTCILNYGVTEEFVFFFVQSLNDNLIKSIIYVLNYIVFCSKTSLGLLMSLPSNTKEARPQKREPLKACGR